MTQSTLEPYFKTPDEIRLENESRKLEERYSITTNERPTDLLAMTKAFLTDSKKSDNNRIRGIGILVDLIENGTVYDRRNGASRGREKIRLPPMNWNLMRTLALIMRNMK
ncbi:MAG: hypothetical protein M1518_02000 [Candidatus Thermoplasmatota archaeon]|nr:hypothetical protein [Candidatus Thermoplasmatota archaeon]